MADWEPVIGLEVHAHLKTRTKMFCRCKLEYGAPENTRTCPVCLAHPGALPVPNARAIEHTITLGLALGCEISEHAIFARKNYFYPDLPKGYQISQYERPLCEHGTFAIPTADGEERVGIVRAHLEEDAAKTVHAGGATGRSVGADYRSEEHTSELQSPCNLVCRLLLEKKKNRTDGDLTNYCRLRAGESEEYGSRDDDKTILLMKRPWTRQKLEGQSQHKRQLPHCSQA